MNKNRKKVSILMPAFNVQEWIGSAIESVLLQTLEDFELIIIDDCSTDNTVREVEKYLRKDNRIVLHKLEKNSGIVNALNTGLTFASGEYIARMDSDDIALPDRLEKQLYYLKNRPDYALVGSQMISIDELGNQYGISPCPVTYEEARRVMLYSSAVPHIWMCSIEIYHKLGGYRELAPAEDYDFLLRVDSLGLKYGNHPDPLMMIRSRDGNTASVASLKQRKAQNYVLSLHKQRAVTGLGDSFSPMEFQNAIQSRALADFLHNRSSDYLARSVKASGTMTRITYLLASALLSPYNAQYVWRRLMYRYQLRRVSK